MSKRGKNLLRLVVNNVTATLTPPAPPAEPAPLDDGTQHFEHITTNLAPTKATVRNAKLEGRIYTVVPMVMITEGVHAGSDGPLFYPEEELAKVPAVWNHKPIVVYHPQQGGAPCSACEPDAIEAGKVGLIMNTRYERGRGGKPGRLLAEAWLEESRVDVVDKRVGAAIKTNAVMEVSTGLYMDVETKDGIWQKKAYTTVARNYRPDHLAILPDQKGACSVADGAGLLRNAEVSHDEVRGHLSTELRGGASYDTPSDSWVQDVYDTFCVYSKGGKMYKQDYSVKDGKAKLTGEPTEVTRRQTYATLDGTVVNTQGDTDMNKKQMVAALIANAALGWKPTDEATLMAMPEGQLKSMLPPEKPPVQNTQQPAGGAGGTPAQPQAPAGGGTSTQQPNTGTAPATPPAAPQTPANNAAPKPQTLEEYINAAPTPEARDMLRSGMAAASAERAKHTATITANTRNVFTPEALAAKTLDELRAIAQLAAPTTPAPTANAQYNWAGMGDGGGAPAAPALPAPLVLPTVNWAERKIVEN